MKISTAVIVLAAFLLFASYTSAQSDNQGNFLLLKNGQVVEGKVTLEDGQYWVVKKSGSRIAFKKSKVDSLSRSKQDVYWAKYAQLSASDIQGHIGLMRWCLKQDLIEEAGNQIDILQLLDVSPSLLLQLNKKLVSLIDARRERALKKLSNSAAQNPKVDKPTEVVDPIDNKVRPVNYESSLVKREKAAIEKAKHQQLLDSTTKGLPDHAVVMFKRKIEPLLIRSCYTAKCHDGGSDVLNFRAIAKNESIPKRMSQENLLQILRLSNFDQPMESKLLTAAGLPHAGLSKPILKLESQQFLNLRAWLISISSKPLHFHPLPSNFLDSDLTVKTKPEMTSEPVGTSKPVKASGMETFAPIPKPDRADESEDVPDVPHNQEATQRNDPFDPEVFNRKYSKKDKSN